LFSLQVTNTTIDLDDLFNDIYYMDLPGPPGRPPTEDDLAPAKVVTSTTTPSGVGHHDDDDDDNEYESTKYSSGSKRKSCPSPDLDDPDRNIPTKELTEAQKIERRERNREHAKRSRLRKKFLLESLQEQIHGLEEQLDGLKNAIKSELPDKAEDIIRGVCGDKQKFTPLPMPSGFGPVKTLMEPDFRLSKCVDWQLRTYSDGRMTAARPCVSTHINAYSSDGLVGLPAKFCHFRSHSSRQSHRVREPRIFGTHRLYARSSSGPQLQILARPRDGPKGGGSYSERNFRRGRYVGLSTQLSGRWQPVLEPIFRGRLEGCGE
jgi:hypothetical protein